MIAQMQLQTLVTGRELTGQQTVVRLGSFGAGNLPASYETYRRMRKHPTIVIARALSIAPIVAADWSVEADDWVPDAAVKFVQDQMTPIREPCIERALLGGCDFGHQGFEKVFSVEDGLYVLHKLKPLLQELTEIVVDEQTGAFVGFRQEKLDLPLGNCLLIPFRVEGTDWYGTPLLENARDTWNQWNDANAGAARYDRKVAGSHFVVEFPPGTSIDQSGAEQDNASRAAEVLAALESSGCVAMQRDMAPFVERFSVENPGWKISILEDSGGRQPEFIERLRYLDVLLARAMLLPERTFQEGQHGTLAEAESHADLALTHAELLHRHITRLTNWHLVDQLLALNFGEQFRGAVRLVAAPIVDTKRAYLRQVYQQFLANPSGFLEEYGMVDTDAIKDALGIPKIKEVSQAGEEPIGEPTPTDAADPRAGLIKSVYAPAEPEPVATQDQAAADASVQGTALNGAQIASMVDVCSKVGTGELTPAAAVEILVMAFPLIPREQIERLVNALGPATTRPVA